MGALFKPLQMNEGFWGPQGVSVGFLPMSHCNVYLQLHFQPRWRRNTGLLKDTMHWKISTMIPIMSIFIKVPFLRNKRFTRSPVLEGVNSRSQSWPSTGLWRRASRAPPHLSPSLLASPVHPGLQLDHQRLSAFTTLTSPQEIRAQLDGNFHGNFNRRV